MILPTSNPNGHGPSLIDQFLAEQAQLSAVDRFSQQAPGTPGAPANKLGNDQTNGHDQARYYQDLLPATPPGPGQQYAFEVDLDACSGCKACVAACHNLNGLEDQESWRDVGQLVGDTPQGFVNQHITTACHHCVEPGCMQGCPTLAYDKDPISGIVRHLDDQCFGCGYCQFKCPYDVPKFSLTKGIVRKCDMCVDRLQAGQAPACVQACPTKAIAIRVVNVDDAIARKQSPLLPAMGQAPASTITTPTTVFKTTRDLSQTHRQDPVVPKPEHAHMPLIVMLTLTQASLGMFAMAVLMETLGRLAPKPASAMASEPLPGFDGVPSIALAALSVGLIGVSASLLHLGRPHLFFRAFLGLAKSWLSREAVGFGIWVKVAVAFTALVWFTHTAGNFGVDAWLPTSLQNMLASAAVWLTPLAGASVLGLGGLCVFASFMLYYDTPRVFWHRKSPLGTFLLTAGSSGLPLGLAVDVWFEPQMALVWTLGVTSLLATVAKCWLECPGLQREAKKSEGLQASVALLNGPLLTTKTLRMLLGFASMVVLLVGAFLLPTGLALAGQLLIVMASFAALAADFLERTLFFQAVVAPGMPKGASR